MSEFDLPGFDVKRIGRVADDGSCIIVEPGARRTMCGKHVKTVGVCWKRWVQAHIDGHDAAWCEQCLYLWSLLPDEARAEPEDWTR